jgi:cullin-associated NEDD8-dissociated protein 1
MTIVNFYKLPQAVKLEALVTLRSLISTQSKQTDDTLRSVLKVLPSLKKCSSEDWYKLVAESLRNCGVFVSALRPAIQSGIDFEAETDSLVSYLEWCRDRANLESVARALYGVVIPHLANQDNDQEVKECAIDVMGSLLAHMGDILLSDRGIQDEVLPLLIRRLENEVTRLPSLRALSKISRSEYIVKNSILPHSFITAAMDSVIKLMGQNDRALRQGALRALNSLLCMKQGLGQGVWSGDAAPLQALLSELAALISDIDMFTCQLVLHVIVNVLVRYSPPTCSAHTSVFNRSLELAVSTLLQDNALVELKSVLCELSGEGGRSLVSAPVDTVNALLTKVLAPSRSAISSTASATTTPKSVILNTAKCGAAVVIRCSSAEGCNYSAASDSSLLKVVVNKLWDFIRSPQTPDLTRQLALTMIGEIGLQIDLSEARSAGGVSLASDVITCFSHSTEETKSAATYCLGHLTIGNMVYFIPFIFHTLSQFDSSNVRMQYLLFSTIKEVLGLQDTLEIDFQAYVEPILSVCRAHSSSGDEGVRTMLAECFGILSAKYSEITVTSLLRLLSESSAGADEASKNIQWTVATSLRFGLSRKGGISSYLCAFPQHMSTFLSFTLRAENTVDVEVRRAGLLMINAAAYYNKAAIEPFLLSSAAPISVSSALQAALNCRLERVVDLGPFKHKVVVHIELPACW